MKGQSKKIAIVVQRYGLEVNGGAEFHARILAEKLNKKYDIEIITTCSLDYTKWDNYYEEGTDYVNGIPVHRFLSRKRSNKKNRKTRRRLEKRRKYFPFLKFLGLFRSLDKKGLFEPTEKDSIGWLESQGPFCKGLIDFIKTNKNNYDIFIFFTYLYYPTAVGMKHVAAKSIFIPTAHDEPPLYMMPFKNLFSVPKFIMYNTESERNLIESHFENVSGNFDIAGVGIEKPNTKDAELPKGIEKNNYFLYVGRIDSAKGCDKMLKYFIEFKKNFPKESNNYKLVLVGKNFMKEKFHHQDIHYTGFIDENLKNSLVKNCLALIMPSPYESLSLVTLEAMIQEIPVIVNKDCEVLREHIIKSNSGDTYSNQNEFSTALLSYIKKDDFSLKKEGLNAKSYVQENYVWEKILEKFDKAIDFVVTSSR